MWRQAQGTVPLAKPRFVHRNALSVDGRPVLPSLSTGTAFPVDEGRGEYKKMSVDASRVDSHSNHIINNTKTNNQ